MQTSIENRASERRKRRETQRRKESWAASSRTASFMSEGCVFPCKDLRSSLGEHDGLIVVFLLPHLRHFVFFFSRGFVKEGSLFSSLCLLSDWKFSFLF